MNFAESAPPPAASAFLHLRKTAVSALLLSFCVLGLTPAYSEPAAKNAKLKQGPDLQKSETKTPKKKVEAEKAEEKKVAKPKVTKKAARSENKEEPEPNLAPPELNPEASAAAIGAWTLRNEAGVEMQAFLVSAHGDQVKIRRVADEKEFIVPISMFDEFTEQQIQAWILEDPGAVDYSLRFAVRRQYVDSSELTLNLKTYKATKWGYNVRMSNITRNSLIGATLEYRIIYDDLIAVSRNVVVPGKGSGRMTGQEVDVPEMEYNDEIEFDTPPVTLDSYRWDPTKGEGDRAGDSIVGIWIRVKHLDEIIAEYKSNPVVMNRMVWDDEDGQTIIIRNRFKEAFGDD